MTYELPSKLPCPHCGSQDSRTLKTQFYLVRLATWRRRSCQACGARFSTLETYANEPAVRLNLGMLATSTSTVS